MNGNKWIQCIKQSPSVPVLTEYLLLANLLSGVQLAPDQPDSVLWRLTADGQYSASSAYNFLFVGLIPPTLDTEDQGPPQNASSLPGWRSKADVSLLICSRRRVGQTTPFAPFATSIRKPPSTCLPNAPLQATYGTTYSPVSLSRPDGRRSLSSA